MIDVKLIRKPKNAVREGGSGLSTGSNMTSGWWALLDAKLDKSVFDSMFELVEIDGTPTIRAKYGLWTNEFLSARGFNPFASDAPVGASALSGLSDVQLTDPLQDGQSLVYSVSLGKWVNQKVGIDTSALADYAKKTDLPDLTPYAKKTDIPSLTDYAKTADIQKWVTDKGYLTDYTIHALTLQSGAFTAKTYNPKTGAQSVNVPTKTSHLTNDSDFTTNALLTAGLASKLDKSIYDTFKSSYDTWKATVDAFVTEFSSMFEKKSDGNGGYRIKALFGLYTDQFLSARGANPDQSSIPAGLQWSEIESQLTQNGYAKKAWVSTNYQPKGSYLTASDLSPYLKSTDAAGTYLSKTDAASTYVAKVTGKGLSTNDFNDALLSKLDGIEAGANKYVHPTGGANTTIAAANGKVLSSITVNNLGHVTAVGSKTLVEADIPTLAISKISGLQTALDSKLNASTFNDFKTLFETYFTLENVNGVKRIKANFGLYSVDYVSARGLNGQSGGGTFNRLDSWSAYGEGTKLYALSAQLGWDLKTRIDSLPTTSVNPYALTIQKNGTTIDSYDGSAAKTINISDVASAATLSSHIGNSTLHILASERTAWNNKVDKVTGKGLSANDFTDALLTKLNGIEAGANKYVHPTGGANTTIAAANGKVLSAITVNSLGHVTSVSSKDLAQADIPSLDWSKITTGKPTTLGGYGITDAYTKTDADSRYVNVTGDTMTGTLAITEANALRSTYGGCGFILRNDGTRVWFLLTDKNDENGSYNSLRPLSIAHTDGRVYMNNGLTVNTLKIGDCEITWDAANGGLKFSKGIYSEGFVSARGVNANAGGGGNFGLMKTWPSSAPDPNGTDALGAYLGWGLRSDITALSSRVTSLESGSALSVTTTGTGNAVTAVTKTGTAITVTKGSTFSLDGHSHSQYLTGITKTQVEAVLTGNITSHTHSYLPLSGGTMALGEGLKFHADDNYFGTNADARIISLIDSYGSTCDGGLIIDERGTLNGTTTVTELLRIRHDEFKWKGNPILTSANIGSYAITSHQSLANYVTLNTAQTISGAKTFTDIRLSGQPENVNMPFFLGIDAYSDGGKVKFITSSKVCSAIGALPSSSYTANDVLAKIKTVDGSGSGLDADLLDGKHNGAVTAKDLTATSPVTIGVTVATAKANMLNAVKGPVFGNVAKVGASLIANWDNDTFTTVGSSTYSVINVTPQYNGDTYGQFMLFHYASYNPKLIGRNQGEWTALKTFAFLDDNVASASRLVTTSTYTAWGKTFFANGVPQTVSGDLTSVGDITMSGTLKSTYASGSWLNGVTNAALTVNHSGYGAVFCAPTKDGRISLSTYPSNTNLVYLGYVPNGQTANALAKQLTWEATTGKLSVDSIQIGSCTITYENGGLRFTSGIYSDSFVSARGGNSSGGASGGLIQTVYGWSDLGKTFVNGTLTDTFNAYTVNRLYTDKADKTWVDGNYQPKGSYVRVGADGVVEAGRYIDFHSADYGTNATEDHTVRLDAGAASTKRTFTFPATGGVLATEAFVTGKNYLTSHQSLANYYTKSEVDAGFVSSGQYSATISGINASLGQKLPSSSYTANDVLAKLLTVDGSGSGLDADLLDGKHNGAVTAKDLTATSPVTIGVTVATAKANMLNAVKGPVFGNVAKVGASLIANWDNDTFTTVGSSTYSVINVTPQYNGDTYGQFMLFHYASYNPKLIGRNQGEWTALKTFAFLDDNVESASRLATTSTYTAWGKPFFANGVPQTVSGDMTGVGELYATGWLRTYGARGWYNQDYGGGIYMSDSNWIRTYGGKPLLSEIASNNSWGIGGHRLNAVFAGTGHASILLAVEGGSVAYGLCANTNGNMYFGKRTSGSYTDSTGDTYLMVLNSTGLRIGDSTAPSYKLDVNGSAIVRGWLRTTGNYGWYSETYGGGWYMTDTSWIRTYGSKNIYQNAGILRTDGTLQVGNGGATFIATNGGNVGINNTSPSYALDVTGDINSSATIRCQVARTSTGLELFGNVPYIDFHCGNTNTDYDVRLVNQTSGELKCVGTFRATVGMWSDGYVSARGQNTSSDQRLKKDFAPFAMSLRDISEAPSIYFRWKRDGKEDLGSIAQYWQRISPDLTPEGPDGFLTIQYGKTALLASISIAKRVVSHEERLKALEDENRKLKRKIKILEERR